MNIVSDKFFIKNRASSFSNSELLQYLHKNNVTEVEMVGVDGNYCVAASARAGMKNGLSVIYNHQCIESANFDKFRKTLIRLENGGVTIRE